MDALKLKPCSFCGSDNVRIERFLDCHSAKCQNCDAYSGWKSSPEEAAVAWNTRTPDARVAALEAVVAIARTIWFMRYEDTDEWSERRSRRIGDIEAAFRVLDDIEHKGEHNE